MAISTSGTDEDQQAAPRRRRRWPWVVGAVLTVAALAGGVVAWMWGGREAEEASVDRALDRFREAEEQGTRNPLEPPAGVYLYRGDGTERLSVLGAEQHWGAQVPATVTAVAGGCWNIRLEYSANHSQEYDYCPRGARLLEQGGRTRQRFDFGAFTADDVTEFRCDPPGVALDVEARRGDHWRQSCRGGSTTLDTTVTAAGRNTFLGIRRVRVGDRVVEAFAYRQERTLTGDQTGSERNEMWFAVENGLPVRIVRRSEVDSPSPLGTVTYTEQGTLEIASLVPRR